MSSLLERLSTPSVTNRPPTESERQRNELYLLGAVVFLLFLGFGIRNNALNASRSTELGEGLPSISYPRGWLTRASDDYLLQLKNPASPSSFDAEINVAVRDLREGETLELARANRAVQRSQQVSNYRELAASSATVLDDQPGLVSTYAYIADPTRDSAAIGLPVVVQAQDIIFVTDGKVVVVTLAADAAEWEAEQTGFAVVRNSLDLTVEGGSQ